MDLEKSASLVVLLYTICLVQSNQFVHNTVVCQRMAGTEAGTKVEKISEPIIPLDSRDFENVYEPAEDTFLFMDALEKDLPFLRKLSPSIVLELGSVSIGKRTLPKHRLLSLFTVAAPAASQLTLHAP